MSLFQYQGRADPLQPLSAVAVVGPDQWGYPPQIPGRRALGQLGLRYCAHCQTKEPP